MEIKLIESIDTNQWNLVASNPMQSWEWGEARKKMGIDVLRIGEFSKDQLENIFQITLHKIPFTSYKVGYLPRSVFPSKNVSEFITNYAKTHNIIFVKIEPYIFKTQASSPKPQVSSNYQIVKSKHPLFPDWTQIINLNNTEDELLKKMKSKTRYNIKLAQKKGVVVKEVSDENGFDIFLKLYFNTCKRQKYYGHTTQYHKIIWNSLKKNIAHILIAYYKNIPLTAYELFYFNKVLYYPYGGSSEEYRNLMATNLIMWEAIRLGKKLGAQYFDMWGSLPPNYNQNDPWSGFTRFKEGYGTEFIEFTGSYDLVINKKLYPIYNTINILRKIYLRLKRFF